MKKVIIFLSFFLVISSLFAQDGQIFSPFVSRLKVEVEKEAVILTWEDSEDLKGRNVIYRYSSEITNDNISQAEVIGEIPMGNEKYIDYPPDDKDYYYAVLIKNLDGQVYSYLLPFRNTLTRAARISSVYFASSDENQTVDLSTTADTEVFAPFISRLKAVAQNNSVLLTWEDSDDIEGRNVIYRYNQEITNANIEKAVKVAEIPTGNKSFLDYPPDSREYYYAVICKSLEGELFSYVIPFRNSTSRSVYIETIASEQDLATTVSGISAVNEKDHIFVSFSSSNPVREVLVYRHNKPITSSEELLNAQLLTKLSGSITSYEDSPIPGVPNYYAVFDAGMIKINKFEFSPGDNITYQPAEIPISSSSRHASTSTVSRSQPLPLLILDSSINEDKALSGSLATGLPEKQKIHPQTEALVEDILLRMPLVEIGEMEPEVLDIEKSLESKGEQYTLSVIINDYFFKKDWETSEEELLYFLKTNHSADIEYRAHFYLAQTYYFQGRYEESFLEFMLIKEGYYYVVQPWLDAVFRKLGNS